MASYSPKLFSINLNDPEYGKIHTITVTSDGIKRLETDIDFVNLKLSEAKDLEYAEFISEQDTETVAALDPNLTFEESPQESISNSSGDPASANRLRLKLKRISVPLCDIPETSLSTFNQPNMSQNQSREDKRCRSVAASPSTPPSATEWSHLSNEPRAPARLHRRRQTLMARTEQISSDTPQL